MLSVADDTKSQITAAFEWATKDLEASPEDLLALLTQLLPPLEAYSDYATAEVNQIASEAFRRNRWKWSAYERFISEGHGVEQVTDAKVRIKDCPATDILAERMKLTELRELAKSQGIDIKSVRTKIAIAERILAKQSSAQVLDQIQFCRNGMLREAEKRVFDEMGELLVHRILQKKWALNRAPSYMDPDSKRFVYGLRLSVIKDGMTPRECIEASRAIKTMDDPFWKAHPVPCERLYCRCGVIAIVAGDPEGKEFVEAQKLRK